LVIDVGRAIAAVCNWHKRSFGVGPKRLAGAICCDDTRTAPVISAAGSATT
jgi:hypothetical protein